MLHKLYRQLLNFLGEYTPAELGFHFPEVRVISIRCYYGQKWDFTKNLAHAHKDIICVGKRKWLYGQYGEPGDFIWHEYAHILANSTYEDAHNMAWVLKLIELNKEYVALPYVPSLNYINDIETGSVRLRT